MGCAAQKQLAVLLAGIAEVPAGLDCWIGDIQQDSRLVRRGTLFLAAEGVSQDGARYIDDAVSRGAIAVIRPGSQVQVYEQGSVVVVELPEVRRIVGLVAHRFFGEVTRGMTVIGVTGTNGKSSVSHYIAQLGEALGFSSAVVGTLGVGRLQDLEESQHTTPDAVTLHRTLASFYEDGVQLVAMEVSSHALDQHRVAGVQFNTGVFTNLSRDHLDYHGSMSAYADAKEALFQLPGIKKVFNIDDPIGRMWADRYLDGDCLTVSSLGNTHADLCATSVRYEDSGIRSTVREQTGEHSLELTLIGDFNLVNSLLAWGALKVTGFASDQILACLPGLQPVAGRMEVLEQTQANAPLVIVDYAHTPDALQNALKALKRHCKGQLWCVFGCGGDRDPGKRSEMGAVADALADVIVITDDNPRTEDPASIIQDILLGISGVEGDRLPAHVSLVQPRERAIQFAIEKAQESDVILLAGKGHETYQEIEGVRHSFSDSHAALLALSHRGGAQGNGAFEHQVVSV